MPDPIKEMSNNMVSKIFSIEMLIWLIVSSFTMGGVYVALSSEQAQAKEEREETNNKIVNIENQQDTIRNTVSQIQTDTAVIRNEQRHMNDALKSNTTDIKQILQILLNHNNSLGRNGNEP